MGIELIKVRASISVGSLVVETPFVQSFNVQKTRGQLSTFTAQLKVDSDQLSGSNVGGLVVIAAGANGIMRKIYTGILKKSTINPCWDDPGYVIWSISGEDVLSLLNGKKYTRRCRSTKHSYVTINSVVRKGLRDSKFQAEVNSIETDSGISFKEKPRIGPPTPTSVSSHKLQATAKSCVVNVTMLVSETEEVV